MKFPVTGVAVHPTQSLLAVASDDSAVRSYDFQVEDRLAGGAVPQVPRAGKSSGSYDDGSFPAIRQPLDGNGALDPPRKFLTRSALDGSVAYLLGHEDRVTGVTFTPDGAAMVSVSADGTLRIWDRRVPQPGTRLGPVNSWYFGLTPAASTDGRRVLLHQWDHQAHLHDTATGSDVPTATDQCPLAVLTDGRFLTQNGRTGEIVAWEAGEGSAARELWRAPGPRVAEFPWPRRGVLSRDERTMVGATGGVLFVLDVERRAVVARGEFDFQVGPQGVASHDLSPDAKWIAATGLAHRATIHPVAEPAKVIAKLGEPRAYDTAVAFHPHKPLLYVGNQDGTIRVWEYSADGTRWKLRIDRGWQAHRGAVTALAVTHDGRLVATSGDSTMKFFPAEPEPGVSGRRERLAFTLHHPASWLQFARDEHGRDTALLHCHPWGALEIWKATSR